MQPFSQVKAIALRMVAEPIIGLCEVLLSAGCAGAGKTGDRRYLFVGNLCLLDMFWCFCHVADK